MNKKNYFRKGQVGIIAVLVGIVIFTLGMSVAARVVTDTRLASRSEEGIRANAAAEAAMEIAMSRTIPELLTSPSGTWEDGELVEATYTVTALPPQGQPYELGLMNEGDTRTVWLVDVANDPNLNPFTATPYSQDFQIAWFSATPGTGVEVTVYYNDLSSNEEVSVWRQFVTTQGNSVVIDPNDSINPGRRPPNFDPATDQFYLVRIKMIEGNADQLPGVVVVPDPDTGTFPIQEFSIVADGSTQDGQIRRRTTGKRRVGEIPAFFDYALANGGGDLVKQ